MVVRAKSEQDGAAGQGRVWERRTRERQDEVRECGKRTQRESGNGHTEIKEPLQASLLHPHMPAARGLCFEEPWQQQGRNPSLPSPPRGQAKRSTLGLNVLESRDFGIT